jgi:Flp pilus assembly protein TadG
VEKLSWSCRRKRRGAAAVEFALVAPLFFMLIVGMLEFGRAVMVQQIITNASREGDRAAVLDGSTGSGVTSSVNTYLSNAGITGATVSVNPSEPGTAAYGAPVTVTVSLPFSQVSWVPLPAIPFTSINLKTTTLAASTVMRRETVQ